MTDEKKRESSSLVWIPLSIGLITSVAIPIVFYRRYKTSSLQNVLKSGPPIRNHANLSPSSSASSIARIDSSPAPRLRLSSLPTAPQPRLSGTLSSTAPQAQAPEFINGPIRAAGAFSVATAFVGMTAWAGVIGVKSYMQIDTVEEFAARMRYLVRAKMPVFSERLHRPLELADHGLVDTSGGLDESVSLDSEHEVWTGASSEHRLGEAFDKGGLGGWFSQLMHELEKEGDLERKSRK